jgi:hypothetical protein
MKSRIAGAALALTLASPVFADTLLTLTGAINGNLVGPQSTSNPCIIAGTQCQQPASMGFNNFVSAGNIDSFNAWSTTPTAVLPDGVQGTPYTVAQITGVLGNTFVVAIDVNTTQAAGETLSLFEVFDTTTNTRLYHYDGPTLLGQINNNGNGWADWTLGVVDLSSLPSGDGILFHAVWNGASDGAESFFLVSSPAIPEPETYAMMLVGFGLLGFVAKRRRNA